MLIPVYKSGEVTTHTIVDDSDFDYISKFRWRLNPMGYATGYKNGPIYLHRQLMNPEKGKCIDHINGDGLDNRRSNLRICSTQENSMNRKLSKNNTSGFKGVVWSNRYKKWIAQISFNGKLNHLGSFNDKIDAAKAYNAKAKELFGDFAWLNPV